jgi:hypothetical protein
VEETGVPELTTLVVICTDYTGKIQLPYNHDHDSPLTRTHLDKLQVSLVSKELDIIFIIELYIIFLSFQRNWVGQMKGGLRVCTCN